MCNISPGDKCRDGRDGDAGSGWFSKSCSYLHYYWKRAYRSRETGDKLGFRVCSLMLFYYPQIIQTKGSYSFLLCGMIIACVGFILFIGLLLFHRMHRNYLAGTLSDSTVIHCCWTLSSYYSFITHPPPFQLHLHPNRNNKKICHGGGTNYRAEWICPHRTERGEHEQLRAAAPDFCPLLATVGYEQ